MNITKKGEITEIRYRTSITENAQNVSVECIACLPAFCIDNTGFELDFTCLACNKQHTQPFNNRQRFIAINKSLSIKSIGDKPLLDDLGKLFECDLYTTESDPSIYLYRVHRPYDHMQSGTTFTFSAFTCRHCNEPYFLLTYLRGVDDRSNEQPMIYIDRLWHVELSIQEFRDRWDKLDHSFIG